MDFWGGGVNPQQTLPLDARKELWAEAVEGCAIFPYGGGFVFNSVHRVRANTPMANFVAMLDAMHFSGAV